MAKKKPFIDWFEIFIRFIQLVYGILALCLWAPFMLVWPMAFDAPGTSESASIWTFVLAFLAFGPAYFASMYLTSRARHAGRNEEAVLVTIFLPASALVLSFGALAYKDNPVFAWIGLILMAGFVVGYMKRIILNIMN